jgi:hypothetical protein
MRARNLERGAGAADSDSQRGLERAQMRVVLAEQVREQARIVEVEFERIVRVAEIVRLTRVVMGSF